MTPPQVEQQPAQPLAVSAGLPMHGRIIAGSLGTPHAVGQRMPGGVTEMRTLIDGSARLALPAVSNNLSVHHAPGLLVAIWGMATLAGSRQELASRLAALWRVNGPQACAELHGHFALCVIDNASDKVLLAVDRFGVHAMHYQAGPHGLRFSTSAGTMPAAELDPQALFNYLYFHFIPAPGSVYRNQQRLQPGEYLLYQHGRLERRAYWRMQLSEGRTQPFKLTQGQFLRTLQDSVAYVVDGAGKLGVFLEGDAGSATLAGMLAKTGHGAVHSYSIGFTPDRNAELRQTQHTHLLSARDVADAIPRIAAAADQPFGNAAVLSAYLGAQIARADGVTRLILSDGGDALFGGNERYARQGVLSRYERLPSILRQLVVEPLLFGLAERSQLAPLRKARSYIEQALMPMPARLDNDNLLQRYGPSSMLHDDFLAAVDDTAPLAQLNACYWESHGLSQINRMQALDLRYTLADNELRKASLACSLAGVEAAFPFLNDEMLALAASLPPSDKLNGTHLRHALRHHLPRTQLRKQARRRAMPFDIWLSTDAHLRELAFDSLASLKSRRIIRADCLDRLMQTPCHSHAAYHGAMVWLLMMLEQWLAAQHTERS